MALRCFYRPDTAREIMVYERGGVGIVIRVPARGVLQRLRYHSIGLLK